MTNIETNSTTAAAPLDREKQLWADIRSALAEPIKSAFDIFKSHDLGLAFGEVNGFEPTARKWRVAEFLQEAPPGAIGGFLEQIDRLQKIEAVSPTAQILYDRFLAAFHIRFLAASSQIVAEALSIAGKALEQAVSDEAEIFSKNGLPHQTTEITASVRRVQAKLSAIANSLGSARQFKHTSLPALAENLLGPIFADQHAGYKAELAAIESETPKA